MNVESGFGRSALRDPTRADRGVVMILTHNRGITIRKEIRSDGSRRESLLEIITTPVRSMGLADLLIAMADMDIFD
jgi:hypothetical protein